MTTFLKTSGSNLHIFYQTFLGSLKQFEKVLFTVAGGGGVKVLSCLVLALFGISSLEIQGLPTPKKNTFLKIKLECFNTAPQVCVV